MTTYHVVGGLSIYALSITRAKSPKGGKAWRYVITSGPIVLKSSDEYFSSKHLATAAGIGELLTINTNEALQQ